MKKKRPLSLRKQFLRFDDRLARHGVPPCTKWWRDGIGEWLDAYERHHVLELVACVGRGAAKSTALYKLSLFFTLHVPFTVPPGERHWAIVLSRLKEEAAKGIEIISAWLRLLGVPHNLAGDTIALADMPRGIRVVAASVPATSGWRAFFIGKDERSKWPSAGVEEREAEEIDTSATAMTATHSRAPVVAFGSAWGRWGAFYEAVQAGSDDERHVLGPAPTWIAAPHITEASTRKKERNEAKWAREYKCEFSEEVDEALFPLELIDRARRETDGDLPPWNGVRYVAAMDPSLGKNAWTLVITGRIEVDGEPKVSIVVAREWRSKKGGHFDMSAMLEKIAGIVRPYTCDIMTDQFHAESLISIASRLNLGIRIQSVKWTAAERLAAYENVLARLSNDEIELHADKQLRSDLLSVQRRFSESSNGFTIHLPTTPNGRHCDYAASVVLSLSRVPLYERRIPRAPHGRVGGFYAGQSGIEGFAPPVNARFWGDA